MSLARNRVSSAATMADADDPVERHTATELRKTRFRNECGDPSRRRAMCCCTLFWLTIVLIATGMVYALIHHHRRSRLADADPLELRCQPPVCRRRHTARSHTWDGDSCAPGHIRRGQCVPRLFFPRVYDSSLGDETADACTNIYRRACGSWEDWFVDTHPFYDPADLESHHADLAPILRESINDRDSQLNLFVRSQCAPVLGNPVFPSRDTAEAWLAVQRGSQLPLWLEEYKLSTICGVLAANNLMADWFYELALGIPLLQSKRLKETIAKTAHRLPDCSTTTAWLGALGDPHIVEIQWTESDALDHVEIHKLLAADYGDWWRAAVALAPYTWLAAGHDRQMLLRVAFADSRRDWMTRSHCERISSVVFLEVLEDRYAAAVHQQMVQPSTVLSPLHACATLNPRVSVMIVERSPTVRAYVLNCIARSPSADWHTLAARVAACNTDHRLQPDQVLSDAFVPYVETRRVGSGVELWITPSIVRAPLFAAEMEMPSVAARLYWRLLRAVYDTGSTDCADLTKRDAQVLTAMTGCFRVLMDAQFWLEVVQLHCGEECGERWQNVLSLHTDFRRAFKC